MPFSLSDAQDAAPSSSKTFKLEGAENADSHPNAIMRGAAERMLGVEELVNNLGIGRHIGLAPNDILDSAQSDLKEQGRGTGVSGFLGEIAGDPISWMGGGAVKGATGIADVAKAGAKLGGAAGLTEPGAKDIKENIAHAAEEAAAGAALPYAVGKGGKAAIGTGKLVMEGFGARTTEELSQAAAAIRKESHEGYDTMRKLNSHITPEGVETMKKAVQEGLQENGLLNRKLHEGTISVLKQLGQAAEGGVSLEALDQHRRLLSGVINNNPRSEDAKMAATAIKAIDSAVESLKPSDFSNQNKEAVEALNKARATWTKARKFEMITDVLEKSGGDPNRRKALLEQLYNNAKKTRNFTKEEKAALKEAMQNNTFESVSKMAGKFGISLGGNRAAATGNVIPALELLAQGAKKGVPVVAAGTGAKFLQNKVGQAKAERLLKTIENGSVKPVIPNTGTPLESVVRQIQ